MGASGNDPLCLRVARLCSLFETSYCMVRLGVLTALGASELCAWERMWLTKGALCPVARLSGQVTDQSLPGRLPDALAHPVKDLACRQHLTSSKGKYGNVCVLPACVVTYSNAKNLLRRLLKTGSNASWVLSRRVRLVSAPAVIQ